jgi:hypothetical protein
MKRTGLAIMAALALVGCSPGGDQNAKNQPISIDRTEIDLNESNPYLYPPSERTNWHCTLLVKTNREDDDVRWKRVQSMHGKPVTITDGQKILATGRIVALSHSQEKYLGPVIAFPSVEVAEELYRNLGLPERK